MSKSAKPRKKYDPAKGALRTAKLSQRFESRISAQAEELIKASFARTLGDNDLAKLAVQYHAAFATLRLCGGHEAFKDVAAAILIAQRFAEVGIAPEFAGEINEALKALHRVQERALGTGRWLLDGDGLKSVMRGMAIYDAQMDVATYGQLREAVVEAARRNDEVLGAEARELMKEAA
jgi:N-acetylglucosamine kinase-like BadF-type ATPase